MIEPPRGKSSDSKRFQSLWSRCLVDGAIDEGDRVHQKLCRAYSEPARFYHTLEHIDHCLEMFDQVEDQIHDADAVEMAIWFHDAVFRPGAKDNEVLSVELYEALARDVHRAEFCREVSAIIIATLHCGNVLENSNCQYMVDIDLSSFGLPWPQFLRDSERLREENPQLSDQAYFCNQRKFQQCQLAKNHFYHTPFFYQRFESQARENLARYFELIERKVEPA